MKAYELKALLATLDDSAEVSIEVEHQGHEIYSDQFHVDTPCGIAPRSAYLSIRSDALRVMPEICAQERIEELEQQLDELKREVRSALGALGDMNAFREGCEIAKVLEELEELL